MAVLDNRSMARVTGRRLPLAICVPDPSQECSLCVGAATRPVHDYGNELVKYFDEATRSSNANTANHFIDKAVWQVHKDDFPLWYETLKEISKSDVADFEAATGTEKMTGETPSPSTAASSPSTQAETPEATKESASLPASA